MDVFMCFKLIFISFILSLSLVACGGSGGGDSTPSTTTPEITDNKWGAMKWDNGTWGE